MLTVGLLKFVPMRKQSLTACGEAVFFMFYAPQMGNNLIAAAPVSSFFAFFFIFLLHRERKNGILYIEKNDGRMRENEKYNRGYLS